MAIGDQNDFVNRLRVLLPNKWFPDVSPVLTGVLAGGANMLATAYSLLAYVKSQTRIATATDFFLDIVALDYFGLNMIRKNGEQDAGYSARIRRNLLRARGTRPAMIAALQNLTGNTPTIFEPANPSDTGGYGAAGSYKFNGFAYNVAGGYGSLKLQNQAFITIARPHTGGISNVNGYNGYLGGYGVGASEYISLSYVNAQVSDADIYNEVNLTMPAGSIGWTSIK